jgi:hypothetical protein
MPPPTKDWSHNRVVRPLLPTIKVTQASTGYSTKAVPYSRQRKVLYPVDTGAMTSRSVMLHLFAI